MIQFGFLSCGPPLVLSFSLELNQFSLCFFAQVVLEKLAANDSEWMFSSLLKLEADPYLKRICAELQDRIFSQPFVSSRFAVLFPSVMGCSFRREFRKTSRLIFSSLPHSLV